jgi:hypothetical protein
MHMGLLFPVKEATYPCLSMALELGNQEFGPPILPFACTLNSGLETKANSSPYPPTPEKFYSAEQYRGAHPPYSHGISEVV